MRCNNNFNFGDPRDTTTEAIHVIPGILKPQVYILQGWSQKEVAKRYSMQTEHGQRDDRPMETRQCVNAPEKSVPRFRYEGILISAVGRPRRHT